MNKGKCTLFPGFQICNKIHQTTEVTLKGRSQKLRVDHYNHMEEAGAGKKLKKQHWYCLHQAVVSIQNCYTIWERSIYSLHEFKQK